MFKRCQYGHGAYNGYCPVCYDNTIAGCMTLLFGAGWCIIFIIVCVLIAIGV